MIRAILNWLRADRSSWVPPARNPPTAIPKPARESVQALGDYFVAIDNIPVTGRQIARQHEGTRPSPLERQRAALRNQAIREAHRREFGAASPATIYIDNTGSMHLPEGMSVTDGWINFSAKR